MKKFKEFINEELTDRVQRCNFETTFWTILENKLSLL